MVLEAHQLYQNSLYSESISGVLAPLVNRADSQLTNCYGYGKRNKYAAPAAGCCMVLYQVDLIFGSGRKYHFLKGLQLAKWN